MYARKREDGRRKKKKGGPKRHPCVRFCHRYRRNIWGDGEGRSESVRHRGLLQKGPCVEKLYGMVDITKNAAVRRIRYGRILHYPGFLSPFRT